MVYSYQTRVNRIYGSVPRNAKMVSEQVAMVVNIVSVQDTALQKLP